MRDGGSDMPHSGSGSGAKLYWSEAQARRFAHDIRGHASAVLMNAEAVLQEATLEPPDREALEDIATSARDLIRVVTVEVSERLHGASKRAPPRHPASTPDASANSRRPPTSPQRAALRVLLVDDDAPTLHASERLLLGAGFEVSSYLSPKDALEAFKRGESDVILSDLYMPELDGLGLLARLRSIDPDVQGLLMTARPDLDSAVRGVAQGIAGYLTKPVPASDLVSEVTRAARATRGSRASSKSDDTTVDRASFAEAINGLCVYWQPIVRAVDGRVVAAEALLRTTHSALRTPDAMLRAAEHVGLIWQLGRKVRSLVAAELPNTCATRSAFVNLHPNDLFDPELLDPESPLSRFADRVVLEITERRELPSTGHIDEVLDGLRDLGYRIAVDDLGAGYSGLTLMARVRPDFVKLDMSLVRGIHLDRRKRRLVAGLIGTLRDLGVAVVGEGVEESGEAEALCGMSCDFLQGFHFGRPAPSHRMEDVDNARTDP